MSNDTQDFNIEVASDDVQNAETNIEVVPSDDNGQNGTNEVVQTPDEGVNQIDETQTQRNIPAEEGKMSKLERENNEYKMRLAEHEARLQEYEPQARAYGVMEESLKENPDVYEAFRQDYLRRKGVDLGSYAQRFGTLTNKQSTSNQLTPEVIREEARLAARAEYEATKGFEIFFSQYPEMDPRGGMDYAKAQEAKKVMEQVTELASTFQRLKGLDAGQAMITAYKALNLDKTMQSELDRATQVGKLAGKQEALATGSGNTTVASSGAINNASKPTVRLTKMQHEKYLKLREENPRIAELFVKNIAESN